MELLSVLQMAPGAVETYVNLVNSFNPFCCLIDTCVLSKKWFDNLCRFDVIGVMYVDGIKDMLLNFLTRPEGISS